MPQLNLPAKTKLGTDRLNRTIDTLIGRGLYQGARPSTLPGHNWISAAELNRTLRDTNPVRRRQRLQRMEPPAGHDPAPDGYKPSDLPINRQRHGADYRTRTDVGRLAACCPSHWTKSACVTSLVTTICQRTGPGSPLPDTP